MRSLLLLLLVACNSDALSGEVTITGAEPAFGPLSGGTRVILSGTGFTSHGASPNRVLIAGREAPLAGAIDDSSLEVEIPPGETAGDAEIVVFNHVGQGVQTGVFHYSTAPTVGSVTPADVLYTTPTTVMTVTGTGFKEEGAGFLSVLVDGVPAVDVTVLSDTQLTFTALSSVPLIRPNISIVNQRGEGLAPHAFRFVPSTRKGLLLFGSSPTVFFKFFDPVDQSILEVARVPNTNLSARAVVIANDEFFISTRDNRFSRVDLRTQTLVDELQTPDGYPAMLGNGTTLYAVTRNARFGTIDPVTGLFTKATMGSIPCCGAYGIALSPSGQMYASNDNAGAGGISTISEAGVLGPVVTFTPSANWHVRDMRFLDQTLYGVARNLANGNKTDLVTINPTSGAITVVQTFDDRIGAMEVFQ